MFFSVLFTRCVATNDFASLCEVSYNLLGKPEKQLMDWVKTFVNDKGAMPSESLIRESKFRPFLSEHIFTDSTEVLIEYANMELIVQLARSVANDIDINTSDIITSGDLSKFLEYKKVLEAVANLKSDGIVKLDDNFDDLYDDSWVGKTLEFGIPPIDVATGGLKKEDFILLYGPTNSGKSFALIYLIVRALYAGQTVIVSSQEMGRDKFMKRLHAFLGQFNPKLFLSRNPVDRQLLERKKTRVEAAVQFIKNRGGRLILTLDNVTQASRLERQAEIALTKYGVMPGLIAVDGVYRASMNGGDGTGDWREIQTISKELKSVSKGIGVPILGTTQMEKNAVHLPHTSITQYHIAYSKAIADEMDTGIAIIPESKSENQITSWVRLTKNRDGESGNSVSQYRLQFIFDNMETNVISSSGIMTTIDLPSIPVLK